MIDRFKKYSWNHHNKVTSLWGKGSCSRLESDLGSCRSLSRLLINWMSTVYKIEYMSRHYYWVWDIWLTLMMSKQVLEQVSGIPTMNQVKPRQVRIMSVNVLGCDWSVFVHLSRSRFDNYIVRCRTGLYRFFYKSIHARVRSLVDIL